MADQYGPTPDPLAALIRSTPCPNMRAYACIADDVAKVLCKNPDVVLRALNEHAPKTFRKSVLRLLREAAI